MHYSLVLLFERQIMQASVRIHSSQMMWLLQKRHKQYFHSWTLDVRSTGTRSSRFCNYRRVRSVPAHHISSAVCPHTHTHTHTKWNALIFQRKEFYIFFFYCFLLSLLFTLQLRPSTFEHPQQQHTAETHENNAEINGTFDGAIVKNPNGDVVFCFFQASLYLTRAERRRVSHFSILAHICFLCRASSFIAQRWLTFGRMHIRLVFKRNLSRSVNTELE